MQSYNIKAMILSVFTLSRNSLVLKWVALGGMLPISVQNKDAGSTLNTTGNHPNPKVVAESGAGDLNPRIIYGQDFTDMEMKRNSFIQKVAEKYINNLSNTFKDETIRVRVVKTSVISPSEKNMLKAAALTGERLHDYNSGFPAYTQISLKAAFRLPGNNNGSVEITVYIPHELYNDPSQLLAVYLREMLFVQAFYNAGKKPSWEMADKSPERRIHQLLNEKNVLNQIISSQDPTIDGGIKNGLKVITKRYDAEIKTLRKKIEPETVPLWITMRN